jgi:hypothetical protein
MANASTRRRREQRLHASYQASAMSYWESLSDEVTDKLMDLPHPKLQGKFVNDDPDFPHSMFTYVWWLCQKGYELKARKEVDAISS